MVDQLVRANGELAKALYLKERETMELRALEEENMALRRMELEHEKMRFGPNPTYIMEHMQVREDVTGRGAEMDITKRDLQRKLRSERSGAVQYNLLTRKVARDLQSNNDMKTEYARKVSPARPPTWAISPTKKNMATPLWIQEEERQASEDALRTKRISESGVVRNKLNQKFIKSSSSSNQQKNQQKNRKKRMVKAGYGGAAKSHENLNVRGRFKNIEMSFGENEEDIEMDSDEEELYAKYPVSKGSGGGGGGRSEKGAEYTPRRYNGYNAEEESDDMRAYRKRMKQKNDEQGKLKEERSRANEFWLR